MATHNYINMILITITICSLAFAAYVYFTHEKIAQRKAENLLSEWKLKEEKKIRNDAHSRSRAVGWGENNRKICTLDGWFSL